GERKQQTFYDLDRIGICVRIYAPGENLLRRSQRSRLRIYRPLVVKPLRSFVRSAKLIVINLGTVGLHSDDRQAAGVRSLIRQKIRRCIDQMTQLSVSRVDLIPI